MLRICFMLWQKSTERKRLPDFAGIILQSAILLTRYDDSQLRKYANNNYKVKKLISLNKDETGGI